MKQFAVALTCLLAVLYAFSWHQMHIHDADFAAFYSATRLYQQGRSPYDFPSQCEVETTIGATTCMPFSHPPILLPLLSLVVNYDYVGSYWRWISVLLFVFVLCAFALRLITSDWAKPFCLIIGFLFVYQSLLQGQDAAFILLGVVLWVMLLQRKKDLLAGACLALTCVKPHIGLALAIPLAVSRPKAFFGFWAAGSALFLMSLAIVGIDGMRDLIHSAVLLSGGRDYGVNRHMMPNAAGLLTRIGLPPVIAWALFPIGIAAIGMLWRAKGTDPTVLSLGICIALFIVPHIHTFDLSLLIIPAIFCPILTVPLVSTALIVGQASDRFPGLATVVLIGLAVALCFRIWPRLLKLYQSRHSFYAIETNTSGNTHRK
jgi:Glycosyltransferase family 87